MTQQSPWRGSGMRNTQEVALTEFLRAWERETEMRRLADQMKELQAKYDAERQRRNAHLMTIGELRFGTQEMLNLTRACTTGGEHGKRIVKVRGRPDFRIDPSIDDWQPKYPTYGGGFLEEDPTKTGQHPRSGPDSPEYPAP